MSQFQKKLLFDDARYALYPVNTRDGVMWVVDDAEGWFAPKRVRQAATWEEAIEGLADVKTIGQQLRAGYWKLPKEK